MAELRNFDNSQTEQNACNIPVRELIHEWERMATAPKEDGRSIHVAVACNGGHPNEMGFTWHELPYLVRWHAGRWVYDRSGGPLFDWHKPVRWRPA